MATGAPPNGTELIFQQVTVQTLIRNLFCKDNIYQLVFHSTLHLNLSSFFRRKLASADTEH